MVPAYFEQLDALPMMPSGKVDRKRLPRPGHRISLAGTGILTPPRRPPRRNPSPGSLATVLGVEKVSVDAHFFNDLGADSLLMAHFCASVRKETALPAAAMQDIYENPSVRQLATCLKPGTSNLPSRWRCPTPDRAPAGGCSGLGASGPAQHLQLVMCGGIQLLIFLGYIRMQPPC